MKITVFLIIELIGTAAFACSGAMVAIRKHLDLLGIIVLGVITAVGGGMLRDILIGSYPPVLFVKPVYVSVAGLTVMALFMTIKFRKLSLEVLKSDTYETIMNLLDAIGLGAFTVVGIDTAIRAGLGEYYFLSVFLGVLTGVGGGILRDIMAGLTPVVLYKHIYACASILGGISYVLLMRIWNRNTAMITSAILVVMIRLLAKKYRWNLPRAL